MTAEVSAESTREPLGSESPDPLAPVADRLAPAPDSLFSESPLSSCLIAPSALVGTTQYPAIPGYEVLGELGRAGMGVVYKARHLKLDCLVAIKMLRDGAMAGSEQMDRFCTEAQILANLQHPNIIKILEIGEQDGRLYMALEFAESGNLAQFLARHRPSPAEAARLIEELARAMHHVHQKGIIHRDLKPANILLQEAARGEAGEESRSAPLTSGPTPLLPKIADFGLGKRGNQEHTISGAILGTPSYMSPEQAHGRAHEVGVVTDVYALGAIFYELLTGQPPFKGATVMDTLDLVRNERARPPRQIAVNLSLELEAICLKCLEKQPTQRYVSCEELADELARTLAGKPLQKTPLSENHEQRRKRINVAVGQGLKFLDNGQLREALVWLTEALRRDAPLDPSSTLGPAAWRDQVHRIRLAWVLRQVPRLVQMWFPATPAVRAEFSPGGQRLVAAAEDGTVRILDLDTARVVKESAWHQANVNRLSFSSDGRFLVSASDDSTARVWDPTTGEALSPPLRHRQWVTHAAFSPDGQLVVTGSVDGSVHVWDWEQGRELFAPIDHGGMLWHVGFSPEGQHLVTTGWNGLARLWNARTGHPVGRGPLKHGDGVRQAFFSADGLRVATASDDCTARVWSVATGQPLTLPLKHPAPVRRVAFSQDDQYLLTWTDDGSVRVWEADTGQPHPGDLPAMVLGGLMDRSPEGRRQLECGGDGVLRLWDWGPLMPHDGRRGHWLGRRSTERNTKLGGPAAAEAAGLSLRDLPQVCAQADGRLVVLRAPDGSLRVHDVDTGEPVTGVLPLEGKPRSVEFSPDGKKLNVVDESGRRHTWDLLPDSRPIEDLVKLVHLLTGKRLDDNSILRAVDPGELVQAWHDLREKYPGAFRVGPDEVRGWHEEAARSCEAAGLWAEAVAHLDVLQQQEPTNAGLCVRRARVWARGRHWKQAADAYARALDLNPDDWTYWYGRGLVNLQLGEWNRAGRDFTRATGKQDCWQAWFYRAVAQVHLERLTHALSDLGEALKRNPRSRACLAMRGCLYAHYGRWDHAAADFAAGQELGENRPWAMYLHALVCLKREDHAGHEAIARRMLEMAEQGRDADLGTWAAWVALLGDEPIGDVERLIYWAERARTTHREIGSASQQFCQTPMGLALCRAGRWDAAITHLENPPVGEGSAWDWLLLAWAHHAEGHAPAARQWLKKAYLWSGWISPRTLETPAPPRSLPWHLKTELRVLRRQIEPLFQEAEGAATPR